MTSSVWADYTPTLDGDITEWAGRPFVSDPPDDGPPFRDIVKIWAADDNDEEDDGYFYLALEFRGRVKPVTTGNHLETITIDFDIDRDGVIDLVAEVHRDASSFVLYNGDRSAVVETYTYGVDYKDVNDIGVELRIPYEDLGLTHGSDLFNFRIWTDLTIPPPPPDRSPDSGMWMYDGPAADSPDTVIALTAAQVGPVAARYRKGRGVEVRWRTGLEIENAGFMVYRFDMRSLRWSALPRFVPGMGTTTDGGLYSIVDPRGRPGDVYLVADVDFGGRVRAHGPAAALPEREPIPALLTEGAFRFTPVSESGAFSLRPARPFGKDVKIAVDREGLVRVPRSELLAAGSTWNGETPPRLSRLGSPVPAWASPEGDLLFYAQAPAAPTRRHDVYVLSATGHGSAPTRLVASPAAEELAVAPAWFPGEIRVEKNLRFSELAPLDDPIVWQVIDRYNPAVAAVELPGLYATDVDALLTVTVHGRSDDPAVELDHHVRVSLAGLDVCDHRFGGRATAVFTCAVPLADLAADGALEIAVVPGSGAPGDQVELDHVSVRYPRTVSATGGRLTVAVWGGTPVRVPRFSTPEITLLDITDPERPVRLLGAGVAAAGPGYELRFKDSLSGPRRYLAVEPAGAIAPLDVAPVVIDAAAVRARVAGAAHVIVSAPELAEAAESLAAFRSARGLESRVVFTDELYDAYAGGNSGPEAIFAFVSDLVALDDPPRFLVLFGSASRDPRDLLGEGVPDLVPTLLLKEPHRGTTAFTDAPYALGADGTPALALGRIPARSLEEAQFYVEKLVAYEETLASEGPLGRSVVVSDIRSGADLDFGVAATRLAEAVAAGSPATHIDVAAAPAEARSALRARLEAGVDVAAFAGHGNPLWWSSRIILTAMDAPHLTGPRATFVLSTACTDGLHTRPDVPPLLWSLVTGTHDERGGAIGGIGATALMDPGVAAGYHGVVLRAVFRDGVATWGEADRAARRALAGGEDRVQSRVDSLVFFGDPAMSSPLP